MSMKFTCLDFLLNCVGLVCLLSDVVLDIVAVVKFYQEEAYVSLCLLVFFLFGSSVLIQMFSWLFYSYDKFNRVTKTERSLSKTQLKLLHVCLLGTYIRHAGVMEMSLRSFFTNDSEGYASFLCHDLSLLGLFKTFSEGAPQFVLMLTLLLQRFQLLPFTVLKAIGSASAIASSVTLYHRSMRSFQSDKQRQNVVSSVVYFLWNLLLLASRLTALALFASVMPCFIFSHFLCSWMVLFFFAWRAKTDLMESRCGEWLYRATVGLIWYFDWFNVVEGQTRKRNLIYHGYMLADTSLLCGLWCWKILTEPPHIEIQQLHAVITAVCVFGVYSLGLLCKIIYYKFYHPNPAQQLSVAAVQPDITPCRLFIASFDSPDCVDGVGRVPPEPAAPCSKRMRKLAKNFYS